MNNFKLFTIASLIWIKTATVTVTISAWACCLDANVTLERNSEQIANLKEYAVKNDESLSARITIVEEIGDMNQKKISQVQELVNLLSTNFTNIH